MRRDYPFYHNEIDDFLKARIDAEGRRAMEAEESLRGEAEGAVSSEAAERKAADGALSAAIAAEAERAKEAEASLDENKVGAIAPESGTAVYAATPEGQTSLRASESPEAGALPVYGADGTLSVSEPASEGDAATKSYVDSGLAGKVDSSVPYLIYEVIGSPSGAR